MAFDLVYLVPPSTLWKVLGDRGMGGKVLTSLRSMYAADKACVLTRIPPSELSECGLRGKQGPGCPASPLLFSL